jgi:EAL domain-containing protein (putative c-di-GMP-specific phosphodiesterase class I)/ActR/RegA family two-component response regulator
MDCVAQLRIAPTLLVVDDELVQRLIVARMAEQIGYTASAVATLDEAAALLQDRDVDIIVLDLSLHDRDGIELLRDIARLKRDPLIIFISGFDERVRETAARLAIALGLRVAGTLAKPLRREQLAAIIGAAPRAVAPAEKHRAVSLTPAMIDAALDAGEIRCLFQPKVSLKHRRILGFEALARWYSPHMGMIGPDLFVPMAERHGLIDRMTVHILDSALAQLRTWHAIDPALEMAVNLSPCSLGNLKLPERIGEILERHGVAAGHLVLEVTEGAVMADYISAADILTRLRIRGVGISVDDFGTGHSSLLSLLRLPFGELKIDQSFVRGLLIDPDSPKIVRAVLSLAASMGLHVVAEGIESEAVAQRLAELGADTGQGYLFAPPLGVAAATALLCGASNAV